MEYRAAPPAGSTTACWLAPRCTCAFLGGACLGRVCFERLSVCLACLGTLGCVSGVFRACLGRVSGVSLACLGRVSCFERLSVCLAGLGCVSGVFWVCVVRV